MRRLSILIPTYNEEWTIAQLLRTVCAIDLSSYGWDTEIIVCDDGSRDLTSREVMRVSAEQPQLIVVSHPRNAGKGRAIRTALDRATGEYVLIQDADLEYDVNDYPALLAPITEGADVIYGSRFLSRRWPTGMRVPNYICNRVLTFASNLFFDLSITDEATGLKVIRTELLRSLGLRCERFEFCPEVTAKFGLRGVAITEVPIAYRGRTGATGKKISWQDGVFAMWVLAKHRALGS